MEHASILITGAAGFIGFHAASAFAARGWNVLGVDNLNNYYDPRLKCARLERLLAFSNFRFRRANLADGEAVQALFAETEPRFVLHLAAQAGVRYSLINPHAYTRSNIDGFLSILEACRRHDVKHLVFASSSSVYGRNARAPFSEDDGVDHPVSLYAATKRANELMAHTYASVFELPSTGLRFFTVYGPWGRPDMAYFSFTRNILSGTPIELYAADRMSRDFTYVDDVVDAIVRLMSHPPATSTIRMGPAVAPNFALYNVGNDHPVGLHIFVQVLEACVGKSARIVHKPMQPGDVMATHANISALEDAIGYRPKTELPVGLSKFVDWYRNYYPEVVQ